MNRSILIVICDFLLVSLLAFSTVDINKVSDQGTPPQVKVDLATNQIDSGKDLAAVMRLALDDERNHRDLLLGELAKTRDTLGEREKQVRNFQQELQSREQQASQLQQAQTNLQQQYASAQTNLQALNRQLHDSSVEALISKEKLAAMEAEIRKQTEAAAALQQQLSSLASSNQLVLAEKQRLAGQLQVAETEKRFATEQVTKMQEEVKYEREEKAKLVEGVKALATNSGELAHEIRDNRPLAPNTIFSEFVNNRVLARFSAARPGMFGEASKRMGTETVLVTDGTDIFALCHLQDTPLMLGDPGGDWDELSGSLIRNTATLPIRSLIFCRKDPRVALMPVTAAQASQLGGKIYRIASDPFKFQDAVLVGAREGYYGECKFQVDLSTPGYLKLDRSVIRGLFGKFNPSRGDLVFSRTGELLGVMANDAYCMVVQNAEGAAAFRFGKDVRDQRTRVILSSLYTQVQLLPVKLQ